jgi:hypothetical protein
MYIGIVKKSDQRLVRILFFELLEKIMAVYRAADMH